MVLVRFMSDTPQEETVNTRRRFMALGLWTIFGVIAASSLWPVVELVSNRRGGRKKTVFVHALPLDEMPEVGIKKVEINLRGGDRPDTRVFIRRDKDGTLTAFSAICTHLGCLVNYNRLKAEFICPCHGGRYNLDGKVVAGPPPAPLNRLPVKAEGGNVVVGFNV